MYFFLKPLQAQELSSVKNFSLFNDQKEAISLDSFKEKQAIVVVFTSSHCSWAVKYEERLHQLYDSFGKQEVAFLAINSNDPRMSRRDDPKVMRKISPYPFPYLKDKDQAVAKMFKATKNPEVFVLIPQGEAYKVAFQGKIDDNPLNASQVQHQYLHEALTAILAKKSPTEAYIMPSGCNIRR